MTRPVDKLAGTGEFDGQRVYLHHRRTGPRRARRRYGRWWAARSGRSLHWDRCRWRI